MTTDEFYRLSPQEASEILKTDIYAGLDQAEVQKRFGESGPNELKVSTRVSPWVLFFSQFKDVLIQILLIATLLSAFLERGGIYRIAVIVLFAVILSFIQRSIARSAPLKPCAVWPLL